MKNKILITAIGSHSAKEVIKSIRKNRPEWEIYSTNSKNKLETPNHILTDHFTQISSAKKSENFIFDIQFLAEKEKINFILPLTDLEIDSLNEIRDFLKEKKITLLTQEKDTLRICRDKYLLHDFFKKSKKIKTIPTVLFEEGLPRPPYVLKPRNGRSSEGLIIIKNEEEQQKANLENYIVQPYIYGDIYTVDIICNQQTKQLYTFPRIELLRTPNGAGLKVKMQPNKKIKKICWYICSRLKIHGIVNIEFIKCGKNFFLMDINPRPSAGIYFTIKSGYDIVENGLRCHEEKYLEKPKNIKKKILSKII